MTCSNCVHGKKEGNSVVYCKENQFYVSEWYKCCDYFPKDIYKNLSRTEKELAKLLMQNRSKFIVIASLPKKLRGAVSTLKKHDLVEFRQARAYVIPYPKAEKTIAKFTAVRLKDGEKIGSIPYRRIQKNNSRRDSKSKEENRNCYIA